MSLRPYQSIVKDKIRVNQSNGIRNNLAVMPTGAGKTVVMAAIAGEATEPEILIAHRQELVSQISMALARSKIYHRIIAPQTTINFIIDRHVQKFRSSYYHPNAPVAVAGVDTLIRRTDQLERFLKQCRQWQTDEAHHLQTNNKWGAAIATMPHAFGIGWTATPLRPAGQSLGRDKSGVFDALITGPTMRELISHGYLCDYRIYGPPSDIDLRNVEISRATGDYNSTQLRDATHKSHITGDIVAHYLRLAAGKRGVTFAVDVASAEEYAAAFRSAGVPAAVLHAKTSDADRARITDEFERGTLLQIVNVDVLGEGYDMPAIEVVSFARPTQSYGLFVQQIGRGLRPIRGKNCVARGTKILTQRGLVSIENISLTDMIWDGHTFVRHEGAVCMGKKHVITYAGLTATREHEVWTKEGWRTFGECADQQIPIAQTGFGRANIRLSRNLFARSVLEKIQNVCSHSVQNLWSNIRTFVYQPYRRANERLQTLQSACPLSSLVLCKNTSGRATLQQPEISVLQELRSAWNKIQLFVSNGRGNLDKRKHRSAQRITIGSNRQRPALRTWQYSMVYYFAKQLSHAKETLYHQVTQISSRISVYKIRRFNPKRILQSKYDTAGNNRTILSQIVQTEREVWDILNAGPFHRFTAQGLLVHNCGIIIDHVGNVTRHGLPDAPRAWSLAGDDRTTRPRDDLPVRTCLNLDCLRVFEGFGRTCPHCGHVPPREAATRPDLVEGDLVEFSPELLAKLRGEADRVVSAEQKLPVHAGAIAVKAAQKRQATRCAAQLELREAIALWAGVRRDLYGDSDSEGYRRFWRTFGVDVLTAQTLNEAKATELLERVRKDANDNYSEISQASRRVG